MTVKEGVKVRGSKKYHFFYFRLIQVKKVQCHPQCYIIKEVQEDLQGGCGLHFKEQICLGIICTAVKLSSIFFEN